jgi:hypothetical protein
MAHAHILAGAGHPNDEAFAVAPTAIPVGVLCRRCGRLHLPVRLWPRAIDRQPGGTIVVELHCVRCNAIGRLVLDDNDADHRAMLAAWSDALGARDDADGTRT